MAGLVRDRSLGALIVAVIVGIIVGSFLNSFIQLLPIGESVVKTWFTTPINLGFGDFLQNKPLLVDLGALKFQLGFQIKFSLMSLLGLFGSLYIFRWYH